MDAEAVGWLTGCLPVEEGSTPFASAAGLRRGLPRLAHNQEHVGSNPTPASAVEVFVVARGVANAEDRVRLPAAATPEVEGSNPSRLPQGTCSSVR